VSKMKIGELSGRI